MKPHSLGFSRFAARAAGVVVCTIQALINGVRGGPPSDKQWPPTSTTASRGSSTACQPQGGVEGSVVVLSAKLVRRVGGGLDGVTQSWYRTLLKLPGSSSSLPLDVVTLGSYTISRGAVLNVLAVVSNPSERLFTAVGNARVSYPREAQDLSIAYHFGRATAPLHCLEGASGCSGQTLAFSLGGLSFQVPLSAESTVQDFGTPASIAAGQAVDVSAKQVGRKGDYTFQVAKAGLIEEVPLPTKDGFPGGITSGPDGNLWFTELHGNCIGRLTPQGVMTEFPLPRTSNVPSDITSGPDGNLWFTEPQGHCIGRLTPAGTLTEFPLPVGSGYPAGITSGPDGNLWFTAYNHIGRITPEGTLTEFSLSTDKSVPNPPDKSGPSGITRGPDGNLWFTEEQGNRIGHITPQGTITEFPLPTAVSRPTAITTGPDGNLWFTENQGNQIGRMTPAGVITEFRLPTLDSHPNAITTGSDGNLWFTELAGNRIGRITPAGVITEFLLPTLNSLPGGITTGPDGSLWFSERTGNQIGHRPIEKKAASV